MPADRVLVGVPFSPRVTFFTDETADDSDGAVTATVRRADGTAVVTDAAAVPLGDGAYAVDLAPMDRLDLLTVTWSGQRDGHPMTATTSVEIVGGFYADLDEIRGQRNVGDPAKWTTDDLVSARQWFEDLAEDVTGVAWVPRFARERVSSPRRGGLVLSHHPVRAVTAVTSHHGPSSTVDFTADELDDIEVSEAGIVRRQWLGSWPSGRLTVAYEHGHDAPPADLREAALVAIRDKLLGDRTGARQLSVATEAGIVRNATASADYPVGIPFVDATLNRLRAHKASVNFA